MSLRLNAMCIHHGTAYCTTWEDTFLYAIDIATGMMSDGIQILDDAYLDGAFTGILLHGDSLVLIPGKSNEVVFFDTRSNKILEKYPIPDRKDFVGATGVRFFSGIVYENFLYLFGYCFPGIFALDLITSKCHIIDEYMRATSGMFTNSNDGCFHVRFYRLGDKIYFPFMNLNAVMVFDLQFEKTTIRQVGDMYQRYISIENDGECFWLVPRDARMGSIVRWNLKTNETRQFRDFPKGFDRDVSSAFYHSINLGDRMILLAHTANMNVSIDFATGEITEFPSFYDETRVRSAKYPFVEFCGDDILIPTQDEFIFWNPVSSTRRVIPYVKSETFLQREGIVNQMIEAHYRETRRKNTLEMMRRPENKGNPFGENSYFTLDDWIQYIVLEKKI